MPTYSYKREDGSVFDIMQRMSDPALTICPDTGQAVRRIISGGAGVVYKGEGWYVTDYKDRGGKDPVNKDQAGKDQDKAAATEPTPKPEKTVSETVTSTPKSE